MKILHTSDWHLNRVLGGRCPRNEDFKRALQQIRQYLDEQEVDIMIVSGDLFRERSRPEQLQAGIKIIKDCFQPFVQRGGTILAISGNHDSEIFFSTLRDALELLAPLEKQDGISPSGRFYITANATAVKLQTPDGEIVQFVLLPYPSPRYLRKEESFRFQNIEQRNQLVKSEYLNVLRALQDRLDPHFPAILVSHVTVSGTTTASNHHLDMSNEVLLEPSDLSFPWSYVALGHLHQVKEVVPGIAHIRYAGSIERMDHGERDDEKSVVLLEIKEKQLVHPPRLLPLQSTVFRAFEIHDPIKEILELATQYLDEKQMLVRYILHWDSSLHDLKSLYDQIEAVFPRWYQRQAVDVRSGGITKASLTFQQSSDVIGTARHYLEDVLKDRNATERGELLSLAEQLFVEEKLA